MISRFKILYPALLNVVSSFSIVFSKALIFFTIFFSICINVFAAKITVIVDNRSGAEAEVAVESPINFNSSSKQINQSFDLKNKQKKQYEIDFIYSEVGVNNFLSIAFKNKEGDLKRSKKIDFSKFFDERMRRKNETFSACRERFNASPIRAADLIFEGQNITLIFAYTGNDIILWKSSYF